MAKVVVIIVWIMTCINFYSSMSIYVKYFICFLPNAALTQILQVINQFERSCETIFIFIHTI